jgi:hypothetical protein
MCLHVHVCVYEFVVCTFVIHGFCDDPHCVCLLMVSHSHSLLFSSLSLAILNLRSLLILVSCSVCMCVCVCVSLYASVSLFLYHSVGSPGVRPVGTEGTLVTCWSGSINTLPVRWPTVTVVVEMCNKSTGYRCPNPFSRHRNLAMNTTRQQAGLPRKHRRIQSLKNPSPIE